MQLESARAVPLSIPRLALCALLGTACFHLAYADQRLAFFMLPFLYLLLQISRAKNSRIAFYAGLFLGIGCYAPHLAFFWHIFGPVAISLWTLLAVGLALFACFHHLATRLLPRLFALFAAPILFTGLEYFRCELWYLRFAWLTPGLAFGNSRLTHYAGVYGIGFLLMGVAAILFILPRKTSWIVTPVVLAMIVLAALPVGPPLSAAAPTTLSEFGIQNSAFPSAPFLTGIQIEQPNEREILAALDQAVSDFPQTDLFLLSEYTLATPPTAGLTRWCAVHQRYLILGGIAPLPTTAPADAFDLNAFNNTAFVIGPTGDIVFTQGKSVPIQFFHDGQPAKEQRLWHSPWGAIGICICYDLSYTRVTDALVRQGAQLLIVPTMDAESWGGRQHELHARIAPARAAEYGIPIARIASSGISQFVAAGGGLIVSASYPGQREELAARVLLAPAAPAANHPRLPADRFLAPLCSLLTALGVPALLVLQLCRRMGQKRPVGR